MTNRHIAIGASLGMAALLAACGSSSSGSSGAATPPASLGTVQTTQLPTGVVMSPTAMPGSTYLPLVPGYKTNPNLPAGYAQSETLSPDGKTLLVLTSGYNYIVDSTGAEVASDSVQWIFVFDVSAGKPVQKQVLPVTNSYVGIAFSPDGTKFYVPGAGEDNIHTFAVSSGTWAESGTPIALGHKAGNGLAQGPTATTIAVTADGTRAVVANRYNDSITLVDLVGRAVIAEQDLRPGKSGGTSGTPGGEYPNSIALIGNTTAYVSSERDREIVVVDVSTAKPAVKARIVVQGNPNKMTLNKAQSTLFVTSDNADIVSIIDTTKNAVTGTISTIAPSTVLTAAQAKYKGASPTAVALSPDEQTLYVANRGTNSLAVISLAGTPAVTGLIPTGWSPSDVRVSTDGTMLFVSNEKTIPGPNPGNCLGYETVPCPVKNTPVTFAPNQYILNLTGSALLAVPTPNSSYLPLLTTQVATNNNFGALPSAADAQTMATLATKIQHVIYIVKENRTYDQILGDLGKGNSDASLAEFPKATTPNLHGLASNFVTMDNFYDPGDVSGNGWPWSTSARESDAGARMLPANYAANGGGGSYDWEGTNRNVNVGLAGSARVAADPLAQSLDADTMPGTGNEAAPDGPDGEVQQGYLWNAALRGGKSVRNYGFLIDLTRYQLAGTPYAAAGIPVDRNAYADKAVQAYAANPELAPLTDSYFRGFDTGFPDFYREAEWEREFAGFVTGGNLPALSLVRMMGDHTGTYKTAIDGINTPEMQVADNDYAVGRLVQAVANSPYAANTLIFIVEDDAQDGPDHVDAHRSTSYVVGPYVKKGAVVSTRYTTINLLRTITDILGVDHLGAFDSTQGPMTDVFDLSQTSWTFSAQPSGLLANSQLPLPTGIAFASKMKPTHSNGYWVAKTRNLDFSSEDKVDAVAYNKILWEGLMGSKPYRTGREPARKGKADVANQPVGVVTDKRARQG